MIEIRFTGKTLLDGVTYQEGSVVTLDDARANMCIDACWAVDNKTGRAGEQQHGTVYIDIHDVEMGQCSN